MVEVGAAEVTLLSVGFLPRPLASASNTRDIGGEDCGEAAGLAHPSHPALRRPSSVWAWSSGRCQGTRR